MSRQNLIPVPVLSLVHLVYKVEARHNRLPGHRRQLLGAPFAARRERGLVGAELGHVSLGEVSRLAPQASSCSHMTMLASLSRSLADGNTCTTLDLCFVSLLVRSWRLLVCSLFQWPCGKSSLSIRRLPAAALASRSQPLRGPHMERLHRLGRYPVADRRVRPRAVVPALYEIDDDVSGLEPRPPLPAVVYLVLERPEERLGDRVVVARPGSAHRQTHFALRSPPR